MASVQPHSADASGNSDRDYALRLDEKDQLRHLQAEFIIPSKADLKNKTLIKPRQQFPTLEL